VATVTLGRWAASAAARFVGTAGYQQRVLDGVRRPLPHPPGLTLPVNGILLDLIAVAAAALLAAGLERDAARRAMRAVRSSVPRAVLWRLHDGSIGDSATWVTVGTAAITLVLASGLH
jgi:hypothetical protein